MDEVTTKQSIDSDALVEAFVRLPASEKRNVLATIMRELTPPGFSPRYRPPNLDTEKFRRYAAFELENLWNAQSRGFMVEMLPLMYPYLSELENNKWYTCLDVGARTGAGTELLGSLFSSHFAWLRVAVDSIDLDPSFADYGIARWLNVRQALTGDIFEIEDGSYDFIVCSHVIEHLSDPLPFARKLASIARNFAFFYCPYAETDPIPGHRYIDDALIEPLQPLYRRVIASWWWRKAGKGKSGMQDCLFFVLRGTRHNG